MKNLRLKAARAGKDLKTPAAKFGNHKIDRPILFKAG